MVENAYKLAKESYSELGVNTDDVLDQLEKVSISLHCWQADDVGGFETPDAKLGSKGGIVATGNFPGKPRNIQEIRQDYEKVLSLLPGSHRLNLHTNYGEYGGKYVDRDEISTEHFQGWVDWAKLNNLKIDFNATS